MVIGILRHIYLIVFSLKSFFPCEFYLLTSWNPESVNLINLNDRIVDISGEVL